MLKGIGKFGCVGLALALAVVAVFQFNMKVYAFSFDEVASQENAVLDAAKSQMFSDLIEANADRLATIEDDVEEPEQVLLHATTNVNVRATASTDSESIGILSTGETVVLVTEMENWYEVQYNGCTAFVFKDYLER